MDQKDYENLCAYYDAAINFRSSCTLPHPTSTEQAEKMIGIVHYECPELMMLDLTSSTTLYAENGIVTKVDLPFAVDKEHYAEAERQTLEVIDSLVQQCEGLSDAEKEQLIYDYIVTNCVYNSTDPWAGTAYGCLVLGRAKCDGISAAMKWALEACGVACITLAGDPSDGGIGHAWNAVCLDGKWYDVDATADVNRDRGSVPNYPAYNVSSYWIRDRYVLDPVFEGWGKLPGTRYMDGSYHSLSGSYIKAGESDRLEELYEEAYTNGTDFVLQFERAADLAALEESMESRLEALGNNRGWAQWGWNVITVPDYNTIRITPEK